MKDDPEHAAPFRLTAAVAEMRIHEIAQTSAKVATTRHALERMAQRDITSTDLYRILRAGTIDIDPELNDRGDWKSKLTLRLTGRRMAGVVVALRWPVERLTVITVEWEDGR